MVSSVLRASRRPHILLRLDLQAGGNRSKNLFTLLLPNKLAAALSTEGLLHGLHFVCTVARVRCAELLTRQNWWRLNTHLS